MKDITSRIELSPDPDYDSSELHKYVLLTMKAIFGVLNYL